MAKNKNKNKNKSNQNAIIEAQMRKYREDKKRKEEQKKKKMIIALIAALVLVCILIAVGVAIFWSKSTVVEMKVEGYDTPVLIRVNEFYAPKTTRNFLSLVERGFYDGLDFHRIIKGFMIQGGDDSHLPADEQATSIVGEFKSNGFLNMLKHTRGTISMARSNDPNSASSQFFICDATASHLDGEYAAFGRVISGMETVDAIADYAVGKTDSNGNLNAGVKQPVIEYIKIVKD